MLPDIISLFERDLKRLHAEIAAFTAEEQLWFTTGTITNSAGNLCLHLLGNLNHFIGKTLGQTGYVRNREAEFSTRNVPQAQLLAQISATREAVLRALAQVPEAELVKPYPEQPLGYEMSTGFFLVHLLGHLSYHLGQINYLRRMQERAQNPG